METGSELHVPRTVKQLLISKQFRHYDQHPGLLLDKFSWSSQQKDQKKWISKVCGCTGDKDLLANLSERRAKIFNDLNAIQFHGQTLGSLALHLAKANAHDNVGFALHPTYGFAYLPGTGLKGMTRTWAETVWKPNQSQTDQVDAQNKIDVIFGTKEFTGRITFHDAWPINWPSLNCDILNSHHSKYYASEGNIPPSDTEEPVPVYFLTVAPRTKFEFILFDRENDSKDLLELVKEWMCAALKQSGVGAKTASGYGRISAAKRDYTPAFERLPEKFARSEYSLVLSSPAFLAGANQRETDCDLRPASLRGILRWWWRTIHAHHVSTNQLTQLEALVWGDTNKGSNVSLSLLSDKVNLEAVSYKKNEIRQRYKLPKPQNKKTIQGLFYISYGMDDTKNATGRYFREPGDKWILALTTKESRKDNVTIPAIEIMKQTEASLWLLTRFGGIGSKSRKGFGSFDDISLEGINSIKDCKKIGSEFRNLCGFKSQDNHSNNLSTLEDTLNPIEIETSINCPWSTLDIIGSVYQEFIKKLPREQRREFGLPRKNLTMDERFASPLHCSLTHKAGKLVIRALIFERQSKISLKDFRKNFEVELEKKCTTQLRTNMNSTSLPERQESPLKSGKQIKAVLLEEKTKKGGWKARELVSQITGNIQNHKDMPPDLKPGDEVTLIVKISNPTNAAFLWLKPKN